MSGQTVPADFSGHMLDLDEDEDLEVFSKNTSLADGSPMPNSPSSSSMVNQYTMQEEEEEEQDANAKDIFITVDNPESQVTAIETFIMYRVVTKTTRSEFDSCEYEVRRRYQDFLWLRSRLEENHPTLIVHPLPEKFVMKGMVERFNDDFIETRRRALHRFLNKISEHPPILSYSQHFKVFLTAQELQSHRKQGPGFLSRMGETVRAVANSVRGLRSRPEEFTVMQEYVEDFSNKICSVDKVTQRIIKEQREYVDELKQYIPTYTQWASYEEELAEPLKGVASCVERCSKETEEQIHHLSEVLVPALHEYVLCAETLKAVMRRRDNIQAEFEAKSEALASRKVDQEALQEEVDGLADRVELANNALKGDWSRWQSSMRTDLKSAFLATAEKNMLYYEKCLAVWESFLLSQRAEPSEQKDGDDVS
ncbi:LOW QUALITY PROTEIN: sorting nexin-7-like [Plectropomus leopardus]|uniref:LOW QUALITY PROTEIN: sorting nexin-7-like n=1 Tax=Plectropomus leopardus TaxID=160734 RepID=UPI001C4B07D5|nr:LOW QUALITY PROTEIN: sorting nexin-7-like [Plectropomus leopardus]